MKSARFYFDFSDIRSFLAARMLPKWVRWTGIVPTFHALDAGVLRSHAGEPAVWSAEAGRRYFEQDHLRWLGRLGIEAVRAPKAGSSGQAARVLATLSDQGVEVMGFVLRVMDAIWTKGEGVGETLLSRLMEEVKVEPVSVLEQATSAKSFHLVDRDLEEAVKAGVFDVPTLVVGDQLFWGVDRVEWSAQHALTLRLLEAPSEVLAPLVSETLMGMGEEERDSFLARCFVSVEESCEEEVKRVDTGEAFEPLARSIRALPNPELVVRPPASRPGRNFEVRLLNPSSGFELSEAFPSGRCGTVVVGDGICWSTESEAQRSLQDLELEEGSGVLARLSIGGEEGTLYAPPWRSRLRPVLADEAGALDDFLLARVLGEGRVSLLWGELANDPSAVRLAAWRGAHLLVLDGVKEWRRGAATAIRTGRWVVITHGEGGVLFDAQGRGRAFGWSGREETLKLPWPPKLPSGCSQRVTASPPRTLLVQELPLAVGGLDSGAELGLSVSGRGLMLTTSTGRSMVSSARRFESLRVGSRALMVIPLFEEEILCAESVGHKVFHAISRGTGEARLLLVNYWAEQTYDSLSALGPVLAETTREWEVPLLEVVGTRPVELWQPASNANPYRVEPERELFTIDLALALSVEELQSRWLGRVEARSRRLELLSGLINRS